MGKRNKKNKVEGAAASVQHNQEPIKLVLKMGGLVQSSTQGGNPSSPMSTTSRADDSDVESVSSNNKYRKRKSAKSPSIPAEKIRKGETPFTGPKPLVASDRSVRDRRRAPSPKVDLNALQDTLIYLHKLIERKDNNHFFMFPINDLIAPGYSKVIKHPMDLSTVRVKIDRKEYRNVMEYKADIKLICVNAMTYNHPETIYYKAALKLLEYAMKTMSKERLMQMRKNLPQMSSITESELAFHLDVDASDYIAPARVQKKKKDKNSYLTFEPIPDNLPAKDILAIAQEKAQEAADRLAAKCAQSKMGFLRMDEDGTTTLNFLNPDSNGVLNERERLVTVGDKAGKLKSGLTWLEPVAVDDDTTLVKPIKYLQGYGSYSSYAPTYDSSFATLTKEESDLLITAYGSQEGVDYMQSIMSFVVDSDPFLVTFVNKFLDSHTGGQHSVVQQHINTSRESSNPKPAPAACDPQPQAVDFDSLKTLSELGINTDFLEHFKSENAIQQQLEETGKTVDKLNVLQSERLSKPPSLEAQTVTDQEVAAATSLSGQLLRLARMVQPGEIVDSRNLRVAMGVGPVSVCGKRDADVVDELLAKGSDMDSADSHNSEEQHHIPIDQSPSQKRI